jgi:hypothetical protein
MKPKKTRRVMIESPQRSLERAEASSRKDGLESILLVCSDDSGVMLSSCCFSFFV